MEKTRSEKLIKSSLWGVAGYVRYTLLGFVSRSVFINRLGEDITGMSTLFATILNLLSISELGFSNAIILHLYRPVAENNYEEISALINFYGRIYKIIAYIVLAIGLVMTPFVHLLITSNTQLQHVEFYFVLYVLKAFVSYLYNYRSALFEVYQEYYVGERIRYAFLCLVTLGQAAIIYFTGNYAAYLIVRIVGTLLTNLTRTYIATKKYPFLNEYKDANITKEKISEIATYIKSIAIDKASRLLKTTTDTIITSKFVNVATTAVVGNYNLLIVALNAILRMFFDNAIAGVGNMTVTESKNSQFNTYLDMLFISFWIYGFAATGVACVSTSFIKNLWLHSERFTLPLMTIIILAANMFIVGVEMPAENYFMALGLIEKAKYRNVINMILNVTFSVVLVFPFGVNGIYIGTMASFLMTTFWLTPYMTMKYHFGMDKLKEYLSLFARGVIVNVICFVASIVACSFINLSGFVDMFIKIVVCTFVYNVMFVLMFVTSKQFKNLTSLALSLIGKYLPKKV